MGTSTYSWFGKLPSTGDFIHDGMNALVRQRWDGHLSRWMQAGQYLFPETWTEAYLSSPVYAFRLGSQCELAINNQSTAGIMMPSVDKVGRYFPFVVANTLSIATGSNHGGVPLDDWLLELRNLCSQALWKEWTPEHLKTQLERLPDPLADTATPAFGGRWNTISPQGQQTNTHHCDHFPTMACFEQWMAGLRP